MDIVTERRLRTLMKQAISGVRLATEDQNFLVQIYSAWPSQYKTIHSEVKRQVASEINPLIEASR